VPDPNVSRLADALRAACRQGLPVLLLLGAHPIKLGLSRFLIDVVRSRLVTLLAINGAGLIHDFELALAGGTSENVAHYIRTGQFGLWQETGRLNDVIRQAAQHGDVLGEAVGRAIEEGRFPHRDLSLASACWRHGVALTCHVTVGADIVRAHPNADGAALGAASFTGFLIFARAVQDLDGGAFLTVGSAATWP
jgi:hypothetical protein